MAASSEQEEARFREMLRDFRVRAGLRQEDIASALGRPQSFVSKYESGERELSFLEARDVCRALGVSFVDLASSFVTSRR